MAKLPAHGSRIWLDQYVVSSWLNSSQQNIEQNTPVTTCFGEVGPRRVVGNYDVQNSELGLFDGADDSIDEILHALLGAATDRYLTKLWGVSAEGEVAYDSVVKLASKPLDAEVAGAVLLNAELAGSGGLSRGLVFANATVTGAGNRTGRNQGAKSSGPLYRVIFRLFSFSGTNITLKLQESQNDGSPDTYADISGLTSGALTAAGIVVATTTAAIEAWRRVNISGTFSSALIGVTAGVVDGTG